MTQLPIHFKLSSNVVGSAVIDDDLAPFLLPLSWFMSDNRVVAPPRWVMRIGSTPRYVLLNRLVFLLSQQAPSMRVELLLEQNWPLLWTNLQLIPPLRHEDGNKWNCCFDNLRLLAPQGQHQGRRAPIPSLIPNPKALPQHLSQQPLASSHIGDPAINQPPKGNEQMEALNIPSQPEPSAKDLLGLAGFPNSQDSQHSQQKETKP